MIDASEGLRPQPYLEFLLEGTTLHVCSESSLLRFGTRRRRRAAHHRWVEAVVQGIVHTITGVYHEELSIMRLKSLFTMETTQDN